MHFHLSFSPQRMDRTSLMRASLEQAGFGRRNLGAWAAIDDSDVRARAVAEI